MTQRLSSTAFYRTVLRDHRCLWFRHLPGPLGARLATLEPGAPICLLVRRTGDSDRIATTRWARMRSGRDGRPTYGVRITDGLPFFEAIPLGTEIDVALAEAEQGASATNIATDSAPSQVTQTPPLAAITGAPPLVGGEQMFQAYVVADYSGADDLAVQRRSIKVAVGGGGSIDILPGRFTRSSLVREYVARLFDYTRRGIRALVGIDHQYGIPAALAEEIGLGGLPWRDVLTRLYAGGYGADGLGPCWDHPRRFAASFNDFLKKQGRPDYFWSATKCDLYGLRHATNPRTAMGGHGVLRLTELCRGAGAPASPKPLSRLGDNGSVGNQSCCGMGHLLELLQACEQENVPLAVWPMDGLDIRSHEYQGKHVLVEPYPSAKRDRSVVQTDENDVRESARFLWQRDQRGEISAVCDLSTLKPEEARVVRIEGWILSHLAWNRVC